MEPLKQFLPFSKPCLSQQAIDEVVDSLQSGWLTTGPKVKQFEQDLAAYCQAPYALALSSATAGLQLALQALDVGPGDEVITTPMTFAATLNVIEHVGASVRLVDVLPGSYNMDVSAVESAITSRTKGIMPVHFAGGPVDLDPLYALAKQYGLRIIEDAAHAIGASYKGQRIGSFGDIQVFSFHPNKNMTTGEGGCVTTSDEVVAQRIKQLRFHGFDQDAAWRRFAKGGSQHVQTVVPGYKFNMMDIQAALGLHQLPMLDDLIAKRHALVANYQSQLADVAALHLPKAPEYSHHHAWHLFAPTINCAYTNITRDTLMQRLKDYNIGTGLHYTAMHLHPYYQAAYGFKKGDFPEAERIGDHVLSLPLFPDLTQHQQQSVIDALKTILQ